MHDNQRVKVYKAVAQLSEANYIESPDTAWLYATLAEIALRGEPYSRIIYPDTAETLAHWENGNMTPKPAEKLLSYGDSQEFAALYENTWTPRPNPMSEQSSAQEYIDNDGIIPPHFKPLGNPARDPVRDVIRAIDFQTLTEKEATRLIVKLFGMVKQEDSQNDR